VTRTKSVEYKHTQSAQCGLIKTDSRTINGEVRGRTTGTLS